VRLVAEAGELPQEGRAGFALAGLRRIVGAVTAGSVTDCDFARPSYVANADGYLLTAGLMRWFWDLYADPADRDDPRASPIRAPDLSNLPPAVVFTCEFDPLRDEGAAYAEALAAAGVEVSHLPGRGQIHTSLTYVDLILSGAPARKAMGAAVRRLVASTAVRA